MSFFIQHFRCLAGPRHASYPQILQRAKAAEHPMIRTSRSANRNSGKRGQRRSACPLHDRGAVVFNRALADFQISRDVLAGMARKNKVHDLLLPGRQIVLLMC